MRFLPDTDFGRKLQYLPETIETVESFNEIAGMYYACIEARNEVLKAKNYLLYDEMVHLFGDYIRYISDYLCTQKIKLEDKLSCVGRLSVEDSKILQSLDEFFGE